MPEAIPAGSGRQSLPLAGLGVVVTRPAAQAGPMTERLEALGARVIRVPLLAVEAPADPAAALAVLGEADRFDLAIFVSTNAVERGLAMLRAAGGLPPGLRLAAIGRATAEALRALARPPDLVPAGRFDSEALLALEELQSARVAGRRVLIVRGEGGRETLAEALRTRGAQVEYAEVYRRLRPPVDGEGLAALGKARQIDAIVLTSGEALDHLFETLPRPPHGWLDGVALVVPSARIGEAARRHGHPRAPVVAREAGDEALIGALAEWWAGQTATAATAGARAKPG